MITLQETYIKKAVPAMQKQFGYTNVFAVPKITKVVVNVGVGRLRDPKEHEEVKKFLTMITGQKPSARSARQAIASFKTRVGLVIGYQVTLRGTRMYDFLSRVINVALPRTRDFQGIDARSFDAQGNLTIGVKEHIVFPEIVGEDYKLLFGLEITIATSAKKREEGIALLKLMGFPIKSSERSERN